MSGCSNGYSPFSRATSTSARTTKATISSSTAIWLIGGVASMPRPPLYKYTPGQASAEELEATFVARAPLLDQLVTRAEQWLAGAGPEHTLLLGPRGIGKTHLLRLLA